LWVEDPSLYSEIGRSIETLFA